MNNLEKEIICKRLETTMIGALFQFEKSFGYLWGHNKADNKLTVQEESFRDLWENTRDNILNNGNNQLRKCLGDLSKINNNCAKQTYKLYPPRKDNKL